MHVHFIIVGCGGTGGHFIAGLGEFLKSYKNPGIYWDITLCDGDVVEEHNLDNQCFVTEDIGRGKAQVMADGLQDAFGIPFESIKTYGYIDSPNDLSALYNDSRGYSDDVIILCGCVDNNKARQIMHKFFYASRNIIYVDSGNDFSCGQVVVGVRFNNTDVTPPRGYYFPDVLTDKTPTDRELGCGVVNAHAPQHISTNKKAANIMLAFLSWSLQEGIALIGHYGAKLSDWMEYGKQCGMISFCAFPPSQSYERFNAFEEKCPDRTEVMPDEECFF